MPLKLIPPRDGRSQNWRIRGTVRGVYVDETTGTTSKAHAEAIRIQRESRILSESVHGPAVVKTFAEAALNYMEQPDASEREREFIFPLVDLLGSTLLREIDQNSIDRLTRELAGEWKPATIVRQIIVPMTAILNHAARRKWCAAPHFERPSIKRGKFRRLTASEAGTFLHEASPHMQVLAAFLFYTGARASEALRLDWQDVHLARRWAVIREPKSRNEDRGIPLHRELVRLLVALPHKDGAVVRNDVGEPYADKPQRGGGQFKTAWIATCVRAGFGHWEIVGKRRVIVWKSLPVTPHTCRRSFGTWLTHPGVHEQTRDEIMGHHPSSMGREYAEVPDPVKLRAIDTLPELHFELKPIEWRQRRIRYKRVKNVEPENVSRET